MLSRAPLQPTAVDLLQRGLVYGPRQGGRGTPSSSLRDEPSGGVENLFIKFLTDKRRIDCRFGKSPLLPSEHARVHVTVVVEGQCSKRTPPYSAPPGSERRRLVRRSGSPYAHVAPPGSGRHGYLNSVASG